MSPHAVNSFVTDLVEMAKAMERVPSLEAETQRLSDQLKAEQARCTQLDLSLEASRTYAAGLEQKVHDAEVARDDAELRFLELDEKAAKVSRTLLDIAVMAGLANAEIDPPKPEPVVEAKSAQADETNLMQGMAIEQPIGGIEDLSEASEGKDQSDPTKVDTTISTEKSSTEYGAVQSSGEAIEPIAQPVDVLPQSLAAKPDTVSALEPSPGPYSGKRYYDFPNWISHDDWLAGGGTEENYDWRPFVSMNRI